MPTQKDSRYDHCTIAIDFSDRPSDLCPFEQRKGTSNWPALFLGWLAGLPPEIFGRIDYQSDSVIQCGK